VSTTTKGRPTAFKDCHRLNVEMSPFWKTLNPSIKQPVDHNARPAAQRRPITTEAESTAQAEGFLSWIDLIGQR